MNLAAASRSDSKIRCFGSRNKTPMATESTVDGPPSVIVIHSCDRHRSSPTFPTLDMYTLDQSSSHSACSSAAVASEGIGDEHRWSSCSTKHEQKPHSMPYLPKRQASYHSSSCCTGSFCSSDDPSYCILSQCEKISQDISVMLDSLEMSKRQRASITDAPDRDDPCLPHIRGKKRFLRRTKRLDRFRQIAEDQDSINSASLPRQPCRQLSFARREKRWSDCTTSTMTVSESYLSLHDALDEDQARERRASLKPQKPRRQKSNS